MKPSLLSQYSFIPVLIPGCKTISEKQNIQAPESLSFSYYILSLKKKKALFANLIALVLRQL